MSDSEVIATSGPKVRGNVAKTSEEKKEKAPKKWEKDRKLWMRLSENDPFSFLMFVEDWDYDEERGGWDYKLRDKEGKVYGGWVQETNTKRA